MSTFLKYFCLGAFVAFPLFLSASNQKLMLGDVETITRAFQVSYAPVEWKSRFSEWNLEVESQRAKECIIASNQMTLKEFQKLIKQFLNTTKDYHVRALFYSSEKATLPFRVKSSNGKYFISIINRKKLSYESFPFFEGDELLLFNGRPVDETVRELMSAEINSNEETDQRLAEIYLTNRIGKLGQSVPKGPVTITVLPRGSSTPLSFQLIWNYRQEKINPPLKSAAISMPAYAKSLKKTSPQKIKKKVLKDPIFQKLLLAPQMLEILGGLDDEDKDSDFLGSHEGFLPTLGRVWWEGKKDTPFKAYLFELPNHQLVGYVRISSYLPSQYREESLETEEGDDVSEFGKIIAFLEERSDALVIDQVDNPGGSVFYLYALVSMLTDQSLETPRHRMAITQADVHAATRLIPIFESIQTDEEARDELGESFGGLPVTHQLAQFILNFFYFILDEWSAGRQLTNPYFLYGIDHINPHPNIRYTKPILVLVNSLAFSGGDFFPAILQDNGRATIMGSRTAGAGGFISRVTFPNLNGIAEIRLTGSIAERADKSPIENLGVTPDIPYKETEIDLQYEYVDYADAITHVLQGMLN